MKASTWYDMLVAVNGTLVTVSVNGVGYFSYGFGARVIDGTSYGLNKGLLGLGSDNSRGRFDDVQLRLLRATTTLDRTEKFADGVADWVAASQGTWAPAGNPYQGTAAAGLGVALVDLGAPLAYDAQLDLSTVVRATSGRAGLVFDHQGATDCKFAVVDLGAGQVVLGHRTAAGWIVDSSVAVVLNTGIDHTVALTLRGASVSLSVDGQLPISSGYRATLVDGRFGLMTSPGTALAGSDYVARSGSATFQVGQISVTILVDVVGDTAVETTETFSIVLSNPSGSSTIVDGTGVVTILDNDTPPPAPTISIAPLTNVVEGDKGTLNATITLTRTGSTTASSTVAWTTSNGTAIAGTDYDAGTGTVTFAAGQTTATIIVRVRGDRTRESDEDLFVTLTPPTNAVIGTAAGRLVIVDNDGALLAHAVASGPNEGAASVDAATATRALASALATWTRLAPTRTASIGGPALVLVDLPDRKLADVQRDVIRLDLDAAGWGWGGTGIDLIAVLTHEIGHLLGYEHADAGTFGVMAPKLAPGAHRTRARASMPSSSVVPSVAVPAASVPGIVGPLTVIPKVTARPFG